MAQDRSEVELEFFILILFQNQIDVNLEVGGGIFGTFRLLSCLLHAYSELRGIFTAFDACSLRVAPISQ